MYFEIHMCSIDHLVLLGLQNVEVLVFSSSSRVCFTSVDSSVAYEQVVFVVLSSISFDRCVLLVGYWAYHGPWLLPLRSRAITKCAILSVINVLLETSKCTVGYPCVFSHFHLHALREIVPLLGPLQTGVQDWSFCNLLYCSMIYNAVEHVASLPYLRETGQSKTLINVGSVPVGLGSVCDVLICFSTPVAVPHW